LTKHVLFTILKQSYDCDKNKKNHCRQEKTSKEKKEMMDKPHRINGTNIYAIFRERIEQFIIKNRFSIFRFLDLEQCIDCIKGNFEKQIKKTTILLETRHVMFLENRSSHKAWCHTRFWKANRM
jgi:hypothetical protein